MNEQIRPESIRHLGWVELQWWCLVVSGLWVALCFTPVLWWWEEIENSSLGRLMIDIPFSFFWASAVSLMSVIDGRRGGLSGSARRILVVFVITFVLALAFGRLLGWGGYFFFFPNLPFAAGVFLVLVIYVRWKIAKLRNGSRSPSTVTLNEVGE